MVKIYKTSGRDLLVWQLVPSYPSVQVHLYVLCTSMQVPPLLQGWLLQALGGPRKNCATTY